MAHFLIKRNFADEVSRAEAVAAQGRLVDDEIEVRSLCSVMTADKRTIYL